MAQFFVNPAHDTIKKAFANPLGPLRLDLADIRPIGKLNHG
jgi:hypothetical protein